MDITSLFIENLQNVSLQLTENNINSVYNNLLVSVQKAQYIQQLGQQDLLQQINQFSSLITQSSNIVSKHVKTLSYIQQKVFKQQKLLILPLISNLQEQIQKITSINHYEPQVQLQSQQETVEISTTALQLQEKPSQNMYQINNILRQIQNTQKITNAAIQSQGESLWRVGDNLDTAEKFLDRANGKFQSALKNVKGYWKILLIVFLFVFIYVIGKALVKKL
ncbi:hypothetical protein SS50377_23484 [Spironucleus salmonicida]|uniref:t-SNARE coiled-coil homology domain-containing protein n=1 Tax=Spironucleus salmonicida TaxID=348837 RepID=V6LRA7_9EUKA|nr:hypothetical protein SS50377_23484 [Spironucleus salmonicida]|eukprot:EST46221.1 Hypothetical protein SS50377_13817 [Spironucleus salmonicida]